MVTGGNNKVYCLKCKSTLLIIERAPFHSRKWWLCLLADSAKDDNTIKDSDVTNHAVCNQELPNGMSWGLFSALFFYWVLYIKSQMWAFSRRVAFWCYFLTPAFWWDAVAILNLCHSLLLTKLVSFMLFIESCLDSISNHFGTIEMNIW